MNDMRPGQQIDPTLKALQPPLFEMPGVGNTDTQELTRSPDIKASDDARHVGELAMAAMIKECTAAHGTDIDGVDEDRALSAQEELGGLLRADDRNPSVSLPIKRSNFTPYTDPRSPDKRSSDEDPPLTEADRVARDNSMRIIRESAAKALREEAERNGVNADALARAREEKRRKPFYLR